MFTGYRLTTWYFRSAAEKGSRDRLKRFQKQLKNLEKIKYGMLFQNVPNCKAVTVFRALACSILAMENTNEEIQAQIHKLELIPRLKKYQYKNAFEQGGGWDKSKKLHIK